jgi:RHS repeat-associated protein
VLNHIVYDAFGGVTSQTDESVVFKYGYTARELDAESGLQYNRARYLDSFTGKFISEDPISFQAGDSNLYRYVENNPIVNTDPSGLVGSGVVIVSERKITTRVNTRQGPTFYDAKNLYSLVLIEPIVTITLDVTTAIIKYSPYPPKQTNPPNPYGGKRDGDDSGHIIPNLLGGGNVKNNVFSENSQLNQRQHKNFDRRVLEALRNQQIRVSTQNILESASLCSIPPRSDVELDYTVSLKYDKNSPSYSIKYPLRPTEFSVDALITGIPPLTAVFTNSFNP